MDKQTAREMMKKLRRELSTEEIQKKSTEITSPITITAFSYDTEDDFTKDNHYRGTSSYTIKIEIK